MAGESDAAAVFIDEADVAVDPTLIEIDMGAFAVGAAAPAATATVAVPRARLGHLVAPLVGMHMGDKPARAAPFVDLLAGWSDAVGEAVGSFVEGRLDALPLRPIVSNPIATDVSGFRAQWHAATNERKVAYSERERVTAWLLNPFTQRPPSEGRVVTSLVDAPVYSEAAEREMRVLAGESVSVVGFRRRGAPDAAAEEFVLKEYIARLRTLKPGDAVKVVRNGLGQSRPAGGKVAEVTSDSVVRITLEGGAALELVPDRYPGFFVFPEPVAPFSKASIARATVSARLTGELEFVLPTTSSEAAHVTLGDADDVPRFRSRTEMYDAIVAAAAEGGFLPPAFDTDLWAAFPSVQHDGGRPDAAVEVPASPASPPAIKQTPVVLDHVSAAVTALEVAARARFAPASARERVAALAVHAAEVERGAALEAPRVSLLSLKYGAPPDGAVVDLGFWGVVAGSAAVWDPVTGQVVAAGGPLQKLRGARHAVLAAEVAEAFAPPEDGLAKRHAQEHFSEDGRFGRDAPPDIRHSEEDGRPSPGAVGPGLVDDGFGDAVAAPGDDDASPLDAEISAFLAKVSGKQRRRVQGAHLIRTVVSYFAERQLRTRYPDTVAVRLSGRTSTSSTAATSVAKAPKGFWLSPSLYAAMARVQDDADILRDLAVVLSVYIPAACKALIVVGAVTQQGAGVRELEGRVNAVVDAEKLRSVDKVKEAMLSMERVLRGIDARDAAAVRQVGDFPDERYVPRRRDVHKSRAVEEGLQLLRPAAGGLNMVVLPPEEARTAAAAADTVTAAVAPPADVFGDPPLPPLEPVRVFDAPVVVAAPLLAEQPPPLPGARDAGEWAGELVRANPWLFEGHVPFTAPGLMKWLDDRVSEVLPRSGLKRGLADRVMRASQGAARHALSAVVLERLGPLLRAHRPQEPQVQRRDLVARADPDTAVAMLMYVLVSYMARAGGQGPLVDDLNDALEVRVDAATLDAQVLEDRFERMREDYRQANFGAMRAMDKADRAIFGELLVHRVVTVGDVRDAAEVADSTTEGEEMVPVNREEYDDE